MSTNKIDKKLQMLDAGMVLFQTEKPFGNVLGGIKTEMLRYGKVLRRNEFDASELPEWTGDCDLFLDYSTSMRHRAISCLLEEAGVVGKTADGEDIRRYSALFKEGNRNSLLKLVLVLLGAAVIIALGIIGIPAVPRIVTILLALAVAAYGSYELLKPSSKSQKIVAELKAIVKDAR